MSPAAAIEPSALDCFCLPLPGLGIEICATADDLAAAEPETLETEATWGLGVSVGDRFSEFTVATVGQLLIASGLATPVALQCRCGERVIVEMCCGGSASGWSWPCSGCRLRLPVRASPASPGPAVTATPPISAATFSASSGSPPRPCCVVPPARDGDPEKRQVVTIALPARLLVWGGWAGRRCPWGL